MTCSLCGMPKPTQNAKYCSIECRNVVVSKIKRNTYRRVYMFCKLCGLTYTVVRSQKHRSSYCSKRCQYDSFKKENREIINDSNK
jgi:hypothetical protein